MAFSCIALSLLLSAVIGSLGISCTAQTVFFPFGEDVGDTLLPPNDDESSEEVTLIGPLPFFDNIYTSLYVNNNGDITFETPLRQFTPDAFPLLGIPIVAPYWADVDTRGIGSVWYRNTTESGLLSDIMTRVQRVYPLTAQEFMPVYAFVVTWHEVGYYSVNTDKTNSFQCVLVTDGVMSFALFLYGDIQWTTGDFSGGSGGFGGTPAQVGFNAGDGVRFAEVSTSQTSEIVNIELTSNVGAPGLWVFRLDNEDITLNECSDESENDATAMLELQPSYGNMLGGTPIIVAGARCLSDDNQKVTCVFGGKEVDGKLLNFGSDFAPLFICVAPALTAVGFVDFTLMVGDINKGSAMFYSLPYQRAYAINFQRNDIELLWTRLTTFTVSWKQEEILPSLLVTSVSFDDCDFTLLKYDGSDWIEDVNLAVVPEPSVTTDVSSANTETVVSFDSVNAVELVPVILRVDFKTTLELEGASMTLDFYMFSGVGFFISGTNVAANAESLLSMECSQQSTNTMNELPPCPLSVLQATVDSQYTEDLVSSLVTSSSFYAEAYHNFFYGDASIRCFRSPSTQDGMWQQCCYRNDALVTGTENGIIGGTAQLADETAAHFENDILQFIRCCKSNRNNFCINRFQNSHPQDDGDGYMLQVPGCIYGDPHIVTLDGLKYTFNGKGEFTLLETEDNSFTLQGRMVEATDSIGENVPATVFSAIAVKQQNSDSVQFELSRRGLDARVNGVRVEFEGVNQQTFSNVSLADLGNSTLAALFTSGVYLEIKEANGIITLVLVSVPPTLQDNTHGLLGTFNGNTSDDLMPRNSGFTLPVESSLEVIHEQFGITWIIEDASSSLFAYKPGESWETFYDPNFVPTYELNFADTSLEEAAHEVCGDDPFCLFDIAATGRMDIGLSTLDGSQSFEMLMNLSAPVVCDPQCVHGICVSNNTCNCENNFEGHLCTIPIVCDPLCQNGMCVSNNTCDCNNGFEGDDCSIQMFEECDINVCQNGGNCTQHLGLIFCECPSEYQGAFCTPGIFDCVCSRNIVCSVSGELSNDTVMVTGTELKCTISVDQELYNSERTMIDPGFDPQFLSAGSIAFLKQIGVMFSNDTLTPCQANQRLAPNGDPTFTLDLLGIEAMSVLFLQENDLSFINIKLDRRQVEELSLVRDFTVNGRLSAQNSCSFQHLLYWLSSATEFPVNCLCSATVMDQTNIVFTIDC